MHNRIKETREALRNESGKKYTQTQFAEALCVTRDMIATYESGRVEPTPLFINSLCNKFNVNEDWLRTGKGSMFKPLDREQEVAQLSKRLLKAEEYEVLAPIITRLGSLTEEDWKELNRITRKLLKEQEEDSSK